MFSCHGYLYKSPLWQCLTVNDDQHNYKTVTPNTSTSQRVRCSVVLEIFTNLPRGNVGQSMTTSCAKVPGPGKKRHSVLAADSVTPTVTVTFCSRYDRSEIGQINSVKKWQLRNANNLFKELHYQINLFSPFTKH